MLDHGYADLSHLKLDTDNDRRLERLVISGHTRGFPGAGVDRRLRDQRVAFPAGDGSGQIKWVLPSRLQTVEAVFAMTVRERI